MSEDNHVCAGDLLTVKFDTSGSDIPRIGEGEQKTKKKKKNVHEQCFHLNLLCLLVSEFTGRESLEWDML